MMPTRVTLGKCSPLAIICVPMRMSILPGAKGVERFAEGVLFRHGVGVHALDDGLRENLGHHVLDALGAQTGLADGRVLALGVGADAGDGCLVAAQMADEAVRGAVKGERHAAIDAAADVSAGRAGERWWRNPGG